MYNTAHFSRMPRTELPGTRMKKPQIASGTSLHGDIIPLFCNLVMPGTVDKNIMNGQIWMSNPIAPIMSQIKASVNVFFVPLRLVWEHTKEFFGENKTSAGPQNVIYTIPKKVINAANIPTSKVGVGSVSHYLHKPLFKGSTLDSGAIANKVSVLKERAYWLCVSEYYRHQQVQNPVLLDKSDVGNIGTLNGQPLGFDTLPAKCLKDFDYFTTNTISPTYGGEALIPLGGLLPVETKAYPWDAAQGDDIAGDFYSYELLFGQGSKSIGTTIYTAPVASGAGVADLGVGTASNANPGAFTGYPVSNGSHLPLVPANLAVDLSRAKARIEDLYTAMAAELFYHNNNYGSRYFEQMEIHYGVTNPDLVMDRPEHVSEFSFDIIVQDVISSAGATDDNTTKLGQPGAFSKTVVRKTLYNHSFGEWGFVIGLMNTYHQRYYSAGVPREDLYEELFDFYFPEFANRGDDKTLLGELFLASKYDAETAFGFQEAYADRRYYQATVTGQLDPYCDANINGKNPIGRWILAEEWSDRPYLNSEFLTEDRDALAAALVSGEEGPDYVWNFNFEHIEILPMPAYSKPGIPRFGRGII